MTVFFIIVVTVILIGIVYQMSKKPKTEKSIDVVDTLLPEVDIHTEIAKTAEAIKAQEPITKEQAKIIVAEAKAVAKPKKKTSPKKKTPTKKIVKKSNKK